MSESIDGLIEAYDTRTGFVARVPSHFIGDPMVGRFLVKTPAQLVLDGDLEAPGKDASATVLRDFAEAAGIDVKGLKSKGDLSEVVRVALGGEDLPTEPDPNTPADPPTDTDGTVPADETPATGDEEN